jgi:hypothetical protein
MFISVGRIWAGRPAAEVAREPRVRRWPWSRVEHRSPRVLAEAPDMPALLGASDAELVRHATRSFVAAEEVRHRAIMLLLTNPGRRGR